MGVAKSCSTSEMPGSSGSWVLQIWVPESHISLKYETTPVVWNKCPFLGMSLKCDRVTTPVVVSFLPSDKIHWKESTIDMYCLMISSMSLSCTLLPVITENPFFVTNYCDFHSNALLLVTLRFLTMSLTAPFSRFSLRQITACRLSERRYMLLFCDYNVQFYAAFYTTDKQS